MNTITTNLSNYTMAFDRKDTALVVILKPLQFFLFASHSASVLALPPTMRWPSGRFGPALRRKRRVPPPAATRTHLRSADVAR